MSRIEVCHKKLKQVLELLLLPSFDAVPTNYLDLLLTQIEGQVKLDDEQVLHLVKNWIITALKTWNENYKPGHNLPFTVKLIGLISGNETTFLHLQQNDVHSNVCAIFEFQDHISSAPMKLAFTMMLVNLLEHQRGRDWIAQTESWKIILRYVQQNYTTSVTKEGQKFFSRLLILECNNSSLCKDIILAITEPLIKATTSTEVDNHQPAADQLCNFEQNDMNDILIMTINLLIEVLEYTAFYNYTNDIPEMFDEMTSLESRVRTIFEVSGNSQIFKSVQKLVELLIYTKLRCRIKGKESVVSDEVYDPFTSSMRYHATMLLSKNCILDFVTAAKFSYKCWKMLLKLNEQTKLLKQHRNEDQAIALMILPLTIALKPKYIKENYFLEEFMDKLNNVTHIHVQRIANDMRKVILKSNLPMESICTWSLNQMLEIIDLIDRDTAVILFQTISHALKILLTESEKADKSNDSFTNSGSDSSNKRQYFNTQKVFLAALLNGLNVLTEKYKLKWQECVETICLLSIAQNILNHSDVDSKISILALKTCKLSIQNFMPPNLALLVDFDEHTKSIGATLFKRIHDPNWEVQNSVLEILATIASLSENKYPPYQSFLLEYRFIQVAVNIVKSHGENNVRASALTFMSTTIRINTIWEKLVCKLNLHDLALYILKTKSEAIVRREAVVLIKQLYIYRKWQKPVINAMSQAMTSAAVLDLHWEVKVNALEFWRSFIKSHLTDQGMLDGRFPQVTFSKENRKIVILNETEIKRRLKKALDELARQHCLGVLLVALKDDSHLEVVKTSADIIGKLRGILLENKLETPACMGDEDEPSHKIVAKRTLESVESVTRIKFLKAIMNFDLEGHINERKEWLQNRIFGSVLDDILVICNQNHNITI